MWIWELEAASQTQHPAPEQQHQVPLCPLVPRGRGWLLPGPSALGSSSLLCTGQSPPLLKREERQVRAGCKSCLVALWSAWGGLFPALLCRLLRHLCKAAALPLQALQTCKKSNKPVNKYNHTYLILDIQVSEFL